MSSRYQGNLKYLQFQPNDRPPWRSRLDQQDEIPKISQMVKDISGYHELWSKVKKTKSQESKAKVDREFLVKFLLNVQFDENIGVRDESLTKEAIEAVNVEDKESRDPNPESLKSCEDNGASDGVGAENAQSEILPGYPSLGDTADYISAHHEICTPEKGVVETQNLYKGYKYLAQEVAKLNPKEDQYLGLMEVSSCIQATHKILMKNVMKEDVTPPGTFSTEVRDTEFKGETYTYPTFETTQVAHDAVQYLVDVYNDMINSIKMMPADEQLEKLSLSFRCASVFLFSFLTLHLFGDGNGRLARLLSSYCLLVFCPFLSPIYNVFSPSIRDDYVEALRSARSGAGLDNLRLEYTNDAYTAVNRILSQNPEDLCALIIESNWCLWRKFLVRMGEDIPLFEWEKEKKD